MRAAFPDGTYLDVPGLCAVASLADIESRGWSLNPGRYVGVGPTEDDGVDYRARLIELSRELDALNASALELNVRIGHNLAALLDE